MRMSRSRRLPRAGACSWCMQKDGIGYLFDAAALLGGVHLVQMLNILEGYDLRTLGTGLAEAAHLLIEAMKPAYADRSEFLGDPISPRCRSRLVSKRYAEERGAIDRDSARPAVQTADARPRTRATTPRIFSCNRQRGRRHLHAQFLRRGGRRGAMRTSQQRARRFRAPNTPNAYGFRRHRECTVRASARCRR